MFLFCFFSLFLLFISFFTLFHKKIMALLILEVMFVICILLFASGYFAVSCCFSMLLTLSVFMVVESVLGLSLLVSSSRESSSFSEKMKALN